MQNYAEPCFKAIRRRFCRSNLCLSSLVGRLPKPHLGKFKRRPRNFRITHFLFKEPALRPDQLIEYQSKYFGTHQ